MPHFLIQESDKSMGLMITTRKDSWYDQNWSNPEEPKSNCSKTHIV